MSPRVEIVWERGLEAAACYRAPPGWRLTAPRKRLLRGLLREYPDLGEDAFARVVHGYRFLLRSWDAADDHFVPETLLRPSNRAKYADAYVDAVAQGLSPPFAAELPGAAETAEERADRERSVRELDELLGWDRAQREQSH